jgi:hypothetical protein
MPRFDPATPLVHPLPGPDRAELRPGLAYAGADGRELAMDLYLPAGRAAGSPVPAVLLVHGEADPELLRGVRSWGQYTGWGRLLAADRLAVAAFSAGVPLTAATISRVPVPLRCAALCYGPPGDLQLTPACHPSWSSGPGGTPPT